MESNKTMQNLMDIAVKRFTDLGINLSNNRREAVFFSVLGVLTREGYDNAYTYVTTAKISV